MKARLNLIGRAQRIHATADNTLYHSVLEIEILSSTEYDGVFSKPENFTTL